jgi:membrane-associated protein
MLDGNILAMIAGLWEFVSTGVLVADAGGVTDTIKWWIDFILHLDDQLLELIKDYGVWTHLILFGVIFCETGLVVTPFLPGDSLLFAAGAFAAAGSLRIEWLVPLLIVAAILGDTVNYALGYWFGEHAFNGAIPFLKKSHLDRTHAFFEKYGGKAVIVARFTPFFRTFVPFVAGIGSMNYRHFILYNVVGGTAWVLIFLYLGYGFGNIPIVKKYFELVMVAVVGLSLVPIAWEWWVLRAEHKRAAAQAKPVEAST